MRIQIGKTKRKKFLGLDQIHQRLNLHFLEFLEEYTGTLKPQTLKHLMSSNFRKAATGNLEHPRYSDKFDCFTELDHEFADCYFAKVGVLEVEAEQLGEEIVLDVDCELTEQSLETFEARDPSPRKELLTNLLHLAQGQQHNIPILLDIEALQQPP